MEKFRFCFKKFWNTSKPFGFVSKFFKAKDTKSTFFLPLHFTAGLWLENVK
jgi:hypothetical protein